MSEQNSGGSSSTIGGDAFGFGGGTTTEEKGSVPQVEEGSHQDDGSEQVETQPNKAEGLSMPSEEETSIVQEPEEGNKVFKKQAEENRKLVIDMLEDKFQQLKAGRIKQNDLKEWFSKHSELAETANRSKRVKEQYRELMESESEVISQKQDDTVLEDDNEDRPLTKKDLELQLAKFYEEQEAKLMAKTIVREQQDKLEDFAYSKKIVDKDFTVLKRNAEALYKANPEWGWEDAIRAAYHTVKPQKNKPVNLPSSQMGVPDLTSKKIDASAPGGISLLSSEEFTGGQLK